MKTYILDYYSRKAFRLASDIIKTEDLDITLGYNNDLHGNEVLEATGPEEDYQTLRTVYHMIK